MISGREVKEHDAKYHDEKENRKKDEGIISLAQGSGGKEMQDLIDSFKFASRGSWSNTDDDAATFPIGGGKLLVFTTDSFTVDPIFFPGGDIGHLAACGTINDISVMGATPLGLSLGIVLEEGFPARDLQRIISSIDNVSQMASVPIATGDTKVMQKGKIDKIIINTSGVGIVSENDLLVKKISPGDKVIISGGLGEHAVALLSKRFEYETDVKTDSKPVNKEIESVKRLIKVAKDPTRGGIASVLNEMCLKHDVSMLLNEEKIPAKASVRKVAEMLGINLYELACEGRFVCVASPGNAAMVESLLKEFNPDAAIIGEITSAGNSCHVLIQTELGKRLLPTPTGTIVPRIC